jgi:hypothetical protein
MPWSKLRPKTRPGGKSHPELECDNCCHERGDQERPGHTQREVNRRAVTVGAMGGKERKDRQHRDHRDVLEEQHGEGTLATGAAQPALFGKGLQNDRRGR